MVRKERVFRPPWGLLLIRILLAASIRNYLFKFLRARRYQAATSHFDCICSTLRYTRETAARDRPSSGNQDLPELQRSVHRTNECFTASLTVRYLGSSKSTTRNNECVLLQLTVCNRPPWCPAIEEKVHSTYLSRRGQFEMQSMWPIVSGVS